MLPDPIRTLSPNRRSPQIAPAKPRCAFWHTKRLRPESRPTGAKVRSRYANRRARFHHPAVTNDGCVGRFHAVASLTAATRALVMRSPRDRPVTFEGDRMDRVVHISPDGASSTYFAGGSYAGWEDGLRDRRDGLPRSLSKMERHTCHSKSEIPCA
jgi:hypothetical protein